MIIRPAGFDRIDAMLFSTLIGSLLVFFFL
jgi:hypothetical protein